jgi:carboxyl-terminal processing protease
MENHKNPPIKKALFKFTLWMLAIAIVGFSIGTAIGFRSPAQAQASTSYDELRVFAEVLALIQNYYVEEKTTKDLAVGAIKGLLKTLDPHSSYMDTEIYKSRKQETEGKFGGLGIEITVMDSYIGIVSPIEGTPADRAGLQPGDLIVKIEDATTKDMYLIEAVKRMRGKIGTKIKITIFRERTNKTFDVEIIRALIQIQSVKSAMIDDETGYLRIVTFSQNTARDARIQLEEMREKNGMKRLVLDLRNNPGGLLKQAVDVSDLFLEKGHTIVSTRGRTPDQNSRFQSNKWGGFTDFPIVVLQNAGSASASEIVAGALKDLKRGVIVGQRSFGKGSVQTIRQLSDGSGLSLTTARYYTPADIMIHGVGIEPHVSVELILTDEEGEKIELPKPIREKDLIDRFNGDVHAPLGKPNIPKELKKNGKKTKKRDLKDRRKIFDLEKDNQLQKALEVVKKLSGPYVEKIPEGV